MTSSHKFDESWLSLGGFHTRIMTFFLGQNHKMVEPFFSWRVEQAAFENAALPGTLNPKAAFHSLPNHWLWIFYLDT